MKKRSAATDDALRETIGPMPPTSLKSRDWISPARVPVKKDSDMRCRWR